MVGQQRVFGAKKELLAMERVPVYRTHLSKDQR